MSSLSSRAPETSGVGLQPKDLKMVRARWKCAETWLDDGQNFGGQVDITLQAN